MKKQNFVVFISGDELHSVNLPDEDIGVRVGLESSLKAAFAAPGYGKVGLEARKGLQNPIREYSS